MIDMLPTLSTAQQDALSLIRSATRLSNARKLNDKTNLIIALDENLQIWTAIQTLVERKENKLPLEVKENLVKLSKFVVQKTLIDGADACDKTLDTLENMNIQIAQGLLDNLALPALKDNAVTLLQSAFTLSEAFESQDHNKIIEALDANLHLWVGMKTLLNTKQLVVAQETERCLLDLYTFISKKTFEFGKNTNPQDFEALVNINVQIAEGFLESQPLKTSEEDALALLRSAVELTQAKDNNDIQALVEALQNNLELWVAIKTLITSKDHPLARDIKDNLKRLADFTAQKTFEIGADPTHKSIDTLINMNLQISEGLLERIQVAA